MDDPRYEPLTEEDIEDLECMELDELDRDSLENLLDKAEDLLDEIYDHEPIDMGEEAHDIWDLQLSEVEDFIDRVKSRIEEMGEGD